ncbi:MAG: flagellar hook-basal body complex protein [bacterium]
MSQGFYTAISGIQTSQQKIDVISDNIANINTVGFKESMINFSDVYAKTLTLGSAPTKALGGQNPMQIGLGTKTASISKNFTTGANQSTGVLSDLYLDGQGFFCVEGSNGETLLTRAGNFSVDSTGYLVTSNGNKVLGTDTSYSVDGSAIPIRIPPMLTLSTQGNSKAVDFATSPLAELNGLKFEKSTTPLPTRDFEIEIVSNGGTKRTTVPVNISTATNLAQIMTQVNAAIDATIGVSAVPTHIHGVTLATPTTSNGTLNFTIDKEFDNGLVAPNQIVGISAINLISKASNFTDETKLAAVAGVDSNVANPLLGTITYTSKILDYESTISPADNILNASKLVSYYISGNGAIEATYSNGDKVTSEIIDGSKNIQLIYKMANGAKIESKDITVNGAMIEAGNLQLQLASVVNDKGLVSVGNNNFTPGPNAGDVMYSIASNNGFARVVSGALESSNVDLTKQFAELIVAQRSVEANSRTFDTVSRVLQQLIQMGR